MTTRPVTNPMFSGQNMVRKCPEDGKKHVWQAKYNKGVLTWWCNHGLRQMAPVIFKQG